MRRFLWAAAACAVVLGAWLALRTDSRPTRSPPGQGTGRNMDAPMLATGNATPSEPATPDISTPAAPSQTRHTNTLTVRILGPGDEPVPHCTLVVYRGFASKSGETMEVQDGQHKVSRLEAPIDLHVKEPQDASGTPLNLQPAHRFDIDRTRPVVIRLERGRVLRGVVRGDDGSLLEDVRLTVPHPTQFQGRRTTQSDAEGRFELRGLRREPLTLHVRPDPPWTPCAPIPIPADQSDVDITLDQGGPLFITVVDAGGKPIPDVDVSVAEPGFSSPWRRSGKTNRDGIFETQNVPTAGRLNVELAPPQSSVHPPYEDRYLAYGTGHLRIQLPEGVYIRGTIVDPDGNPLRGLASVLARIEPTPFEANTKANASATGRFRLGPLAPGTYWVHALAGRSESKIRRVRAPASDVRLVVPPATKSLRGRLVVDDLTGWSVSWEYGRSGHGATLAPDGSFKILSSIPDAKGSLIARGPQGKYALAEDVLPCEGPFELRPAQGGVITGRVLGHNPGGGRLAVSGRRNDLMIGGPLAPDGTFRVTHVPPGLWRVSLHFDGGVVDVVDDVRAGDDVILRAPEPKDR